MPSSITATPAAQIFPVQAPEAKGADKAQQIAAIPHQDMFIPASDKAPIAVPIAPNKIEAKVDAHPYLHHVEAAFQQAGTEISKFCHDGLKATEHGAEVFEHACADFGKSIEDHAKAFWAAHFAKQSAQQAPQVQKA